MRRALAAVLLAGCGGASGSLSGDVAGAPLGVSSATQLLDASASSFPVTLVLTSAPALCEALVKGVRPGSEARAEVQLDHVDASGRSLGVDTGSYEVIPPGQPVARGKESRLALVRLLRTDPACANTLADPDSVATSGTVVVEGVGENLHGTLTVSTSNGGPHVGAFSAPLCHGLDASRVPACAE